MCASDEASRKGKDRVVDMIRTLRKESSSDGDQQDVTPEAEFPCIRASGAGIVMA